MEQNQTSTKTRHKGSKYQNVVNTQKDVSTNGASFNVWENFRNFEISGTMVWFSDFWKSACTKMGHKYKSLKFYTSTKRCAFWRFNFGYIQNFLIQSLFPVSFFNFQFKKVKTAKTRDKVLKYQNVADA